MIQLMQGINDGLMYEYERIENAEKEKREVIKIYEGGRKIPNATRIDVWTKDLSKERFDVKVGDYVLVSPIYRSALICQMTPYKRLYSYTYKKKNETNDIIGRVTKKTFRGNIYVEGVKNMKRDYTGYEQTCFNKYGFFIKYDAEIWKLYHPTEADFERVKALGRFIE